MMLRPLPLLLEGEPATEAPAAPAIQPSEAAPPATEKRRGPGRPPNEERGLPPAEKRSHKKKAPPSGGRDWGAIKVKLAKYLAAGHEAAAKLTGQPILALAKTPMDEAAELSGAVCDIFEHHDIPISPRLLAWLNLTGVLLMVYVPRILLIDYSRKLKAQQAERRVPQGATAASASEAAPKIDFSQNR